MLGTETERGVSFDDSDKKKWRGFCHTFFYLTISGDYKPEFTPLVGLDLLHIVQPHLSRVGPVTSSVGGTEFKEVLMIPVLPWSP